MSTLRDIEYICPFCKEKFNFLTQCSYYISGQFLDYKPFGAAEIPNPIPKCPKCSFVFFDNMFTNEEINKIKISLSNNNIFILEPEMPNYYYLAKIFELLDKDTETIIYYYHSAIWESNNKLFKNIANIILKYFENIEKENKNYYIYKFIKIDFLRRLSRFDEAEELVYDLMFDEEDFPGKYSNVLDYQLELIQNEDIDEHEMPEEEEKEHEDN